MSAMTAAAEPPDDPPATRSSAHGLRTGPKCVTAEVPPSANSCRFSLPSRTAPALFKRTTTSASSVGTRSLKTPLAAVVRTPAVSMLSLRPIGMPWSGPRGRPRRSSLSISRAVASACSRVTVMNALIARSCRSMRARHASVSSTGDTVLSAQKLGSLFQRERPQTLRLPRLIGRRLGGGGLVPRSLREGGRRQRRIRGRSEAGQDERSSGQVRPQTHRHAAPPAIDSDARVGSTREVYAITADARSPAISTGG